MFRTLLASIAGAGVMYFLDPDRGRRRRNIALDRVAATVRRASRRTERFRRVAGAELYGVAQKAAHALDEERMPPNDATLARKVETKLFAGPNLPKGRINVNAEHGVVVLRGELDRPEQIDAVEKAARKVSGVLDVKNLLHLTGTPART
jgi:hypothetical protein